MTFQSNNIEVSPEVRKQIEAFIKRRHYDVYGWKDELIKAISAENDLKQQEG